MQYATQPTYPTYPEFPIWVAFDRHTGLGAEAIIAASKEIGVDPSMSLWIAFYIEGSKCSNMTPSPYWDKYLQCRYYAHKISSEEAGDIWNRLAPVIQGLLKDRVEHIKEVLGRYEPVEEEQLALF